MMNAIRIVLLTVCIAGVAFPACAETNFLVGIDPIGFLASPDMDEFEISNGFSTEEIEGNGSWFPSVKIGIGFDLPRFYIDLTGGVGLTLNDALNATDYFGDLALLSKVDRNGIFAIGPHASFISFNPSWDGHANIEFDDTTGWLVGIKFYVGGSRVKFSCAIDYLSADFDVTGKSGWVPNSDTLDLSGPSIQLGILFRN